jgi:hypothetical protein
MNPPTPAPVRKPMAVNASFGRTWDAVVAAFKARNRTISTDRRSGSVLSGPWAVLESDSSWSDCGTAGANARVMRPDNVHYTVVVKGDSTASTVLATAVFGAAAGLLVTQCTSKGTWEAEFEADVKSRAERH